MSGALSSTSAVHLVRAAHLGPTLAVTALTALLATAFGLGPPWAVIVTAAVLAGQLTIGWSNDLVDLARDRAVGRVDKPLARGDLAEGSVRIAIGVAMAACVGLSVACGWRCAAVHLGLGVASGWAYNLGLKRTVWSPAPYAVAFGALPAVVSLAGPGGTWPPVWTAGTGALLGLGAHLLNALPDLADDAVTGVRSLPQRVGPRWVRVLAPVALLGGSVVAVTARATPLLPWGAAVLGLCVVLTLVATVARGRVPFAAAVGIALIDVFALAVR